MTSVLLYDGTRHKGLSHTPSRMSCSITQTAGATSIPDLSGNGLTGLLPNGGTFNGDYLYLNATNSQWVNISSGLQSYLNTQVGELRCWSSARAL